jgi:hypothetical protein
MHIESWSGKATLIIAALVALVSAIIVEFQAIEHLMPFRILRNCGVIFTLIGWFVTWRRMTPLVRPITRASWSGHPEDDRFTVIVIPTKEHKKGKNPRIDFMRLDRTLFVPSVECKIEENGDIKMSLHRNRNISFPEDFFVRVSV